MNIIQIIPGSGGTFYCGNCLRDSKIVVALRKEGHQVIKIPMYLPLFADEHDISDIPVFYGAVSIYLKQLYPVFRKAPPWFDKFLNAKPFLKLAASRSGSTDAKGLEEMTVSMLQGEDGRQQDELERMTSWMVENCRPDIIHLSNALLLGLSRRIRETMDVPLVCSLQDEDVWIDAMKPEFREKIWKLMHEKSQNVDAFIAVSKFYAGEMSKRMDLPPEKVIPIYLGVDPAEYEFIPPAEKERNIGFISRMCYENGLDIAIDAFLLLKKQAAFSDVKMVITGGSTPYDSKYLSKLMKSIDKAGLTGSVDFHADFAGKGRTEFFRKIAIASVPVRNGEAFGIYLPELMASGIPVIQPALGAFPEIIGLGGGGIVYTPNTAGKLAETWAAVLSDSRLMSDFGFSGRKGVEHSFNIHDRALEMLAFYEQVIRNKKRDVT